MTIPFMFDHDTCVPTCQERQSLWQEALALFNPVAADLRSFNTALRALGRGEPICRRDVEIG